nr:hypothetical protein F36G9.10 - Caenorhabditis elegans [Caenorhabditis elegans]
MPIEVAPSWYLRSMHFTAIVTTPVNIFGIFVILFCQTRQLSSFRWHLLAYQICSMSTDFSLSSGIMPVIFSPFPMGQPHELFTTLFQLLGFETSTKIQCITTPILVFYAPILVVVGTIMFNVPNSQLSFFISAICLSCHTFFGTLSMMYFNRVYREWIIGTIKNRSLTTSVPSSKFLHARNRFNMNTAIF